MFNQPIEPQIIELKTRKDIYKIPNRLAIGYNKHLDVFALAPTSDIAYLINITSEGSLKWLMDYIAKSETSYLVWDIIKLYSNLFRVIGNVELPKKFIDTWLVWRTLENSTDNAKNHLDLNRLVIGYKDELADNALDNVCMMACKCMKIFNERMRKYAKI